jgi:glycosyltransferase involved in cell wall biosynthesis
MSSSIFDSVLYVAPDYHRWKGGISSVIIEYKKSIKNFQFSPSTTSANIYLTTLSFPFLIVSFCLKLAVKKKIKTIHIHGASRGSFYRKFIFFFISKYLYKKKVIYHIHGAGYHIFYQTASPMIRKGVRWMINNSDTLIVLSEWWKSFFEKEFSPKKIKIVPNIVAEPDLSLVKSENINKTSKQLKNDSVVNLLFLGRIGDRKGIFDLLEAIALNIEYFRDRCHLKIGGDGEIDRLLSYIHSNNLSDVVEFIGFVQGKEKETVLIETDVYILPSYNEGLPISILEAMSFAKPILSTRVGGIPEIVSDGYNGILFEPGDQDEMIKALKVLIEDKQKIKLYGSRSYEFVKENHFPDSVLEILSELYYELR